MALRKTFTLQGKSYVHGGFWSTPQKDETVIAECYIKVVSVSGDKENVAAKVEFTSPNVSGARTYVFAPLMDGDNFIKQSYEHLKSLDEFAGATDC